MWSYHGVKPSIVPVALFIAGIAILVPLAFHDAAVPACKDAWSGRVQASVALPLDTPVAGNVTASAGHVNYTVDLLSSQDRYDIRLEVPVGVDLDLLLRDNLDVLVASSTTRAQGVNESIWYRAAFPGTFTVSVAWIAGAANASFVITALHVVNTGAPVLESYNVSLNNSIIFNQYTFFTWYRDAGGFEPLHVTLRLNGVDHAMVPDGAAPWNFTAGVRYTRSFPKLEKGTHTFRFTASDGISAAPTPQWIVNVSAPASVPVTVAQPFIEPFGPGFNAGGGWTNTSVDATWSISTARFRSAPSSARVVAGNYLGSSGNLNSPLLDLTHASSYLLTFGYLLEAPFQTGLLDNSYCAIQVNMSGTWQKLLDFNSVAGEWTRVQLNLTAYARSYVRLRFHFYGFWLPFGQSNFMHVDDVEVRAVTGIDSFITRLGSPSITPAQGHDYTVFTATVRYVESHGIFPESLSLRVLDGILPVKEIAFLEANKSDWDVTDGKWYRASFQLFDTTTPACNVWLNGVPTIITFFPGKSLPVASAAFPYTLDFEGSGDPAYYIMDDPYFGSTRLVQSGGNTRLVLGTYSGDPDELFVARRLGLVTPVIHLATDVQVFLTFDHDFPLPGGIARVGISTSNGSTWTTLRTYVQASSGPVSVNLTSYVGQRVMIRFYLETTFIFGGVGSSWSIDNVSIHEVDLTPPVIASVNVQDGQRLRGIARIEVIASDVGFGIAGGSLRVQGLVVDSAGVQGGILVFELDTTSITAGSHVLEIVVVDGAGNEAILAVGVTIDNFPYELVIVLLGSVAGIAGFAAYKIKKDKIPVREVPARLRRAILEPAREPSKELIGKILDVTVIFRRVDLPALLQRIGDPSLRPAALAAHLRYMLASGLLHGKFDGKVLAREFPAKEAVKAGGKAPGTGIARDLAGELAVRDDDIVALVCKAPATRFDDLVLALGIPGLLATHVEDALVRLASGGKLSCHFDGDDVVNDAWVNRGAAGVDPVATVVDAIGPEGIDDHRVTLDARVPDILAWLCEHGTTTFTSLVDELSLPGTVDDVEAIVFRLVKDGELPGFLDGDGYVA